MNDAIEGWGAQLVGATLEDPFVAAPIPKGKSRRMLCQLLCSFFSQGKCIPLSLTGALTLELELGDSDDCFDTTNTKGFIWSLERMMLYADVLQVDPSVNNSFSQHLLSGKSLPIPFTGIFSFQTSLASTNAYATVPIQRGFSRLVAIYFNFVVNGFSPVSWFQSPLNGVISDVDNDNYQVSIQFGAEKIPTFDTMGVCESFYRLRKTQLLLDGNDSMSLSYRTYVHHRFIQGYSLEKAAGEAVHSGTNTLQGGIVYLQLRNCPAADSVHVICLYDAVASITAGGVEYQF